MKDLSPEDRPREKLRTRGALALGDAELLALLVGSGCRQRGALAVAHALLAAHGGLHGLARATCGDFARVAGVGPAKSAQLVAALELGRRALTCGPSERPQLLFPRDAAAYLLPAFGSRSAEIMGVVLLDSKHRVQRTAIVASGTLNAVHVEPRDVFREATVGAAAAIVVFHNHPSGDPTPSRDDEELTRRLTAAGVLMGIDVVDHIILGDGCYYSFREMSRL